MLPQSSKPKRAAQAVDFETIASTVRELIAAGKRKTALEQAKNAHKAHGTPASEALLIDAYLARVESLSQAGLHVEATAVLNLVRDRFPGAKGRLEALKVDNLARSGNLDELLAPLTDPALSPERLAVIERAIQEHVSDPGWIASSTLLPAEHPLRQAAAAVQRAFAAATTGPVADEILTMPEVSRRSPLAPWKMLVWAIASMYRRDTEACRRYLAAIPADSAPARLIPVLETIQAGQPFSSRSQLTRAGQALLGELHGNMDVLAQAAKKLDAAMEDGHEDGEILQAIRETVAECRRTAPVHLEKLKQYAFLRAYSHVNAKALIAALGGSPRQDATFHLLFARSQERDDLQGEACISWYVFLEKAVEEGWFTAESPEAAAVYLHMAKLLADCAPWEVEEYKKALKARVSAGMPTDTASLYERASAIDPHPSVFNECLQWAKTRSGPGAEKVAERWRQARPRDIEPLLFLISAFEKRKAFPTALRHLATAEQIDGVNPDVRKARLRITCANLYKQMQQRPIRDAADKTLAAISEMPQTQQSDRPAFVMALRYILCLCRQDHPAAEIHRAEMERFLGSATTATLLAIIVGKACKFSANKNLELPAGDRDGLPAKVARIAALAADLDLAMDVPRIWMEEAEKQFKRVSKSLDLGQLRHLGACALFNRNDEFAFAISVEGLGRGASAEAEFLLLRAHAVLYRGRERAMVCAIAAAGIARQRQDLELSARAIDFLDETLKEHINTFKPEQIERVLATEKAETKMAAWGRGPNYLDLIEPQCNCPECRQARGEARGEDPFDLDEDEPFDLGGMPPEFAEMLLEAMTEGVARNETPEQTIERLSREFAMGIPFRGKRKKRR